MVMTTGVKDLQGTKIGAVVYRGGRGPWVPHFFVRKLHDEPTQITQVIHQIITAGNPTRCGVASHRRVTKNLRWMEMVGQGLVVGERLGQNG